MFCGMRQKLHKVAGRMLKDEMEADDAVQDAFCNLWATWAADLPDTTDQARFKMFAVLKNVCINKLKRKRPDHGIDMLEIAVDPIEHADSERLKELLLKCLTPIQREVFCLSTYQDMEYEEIAESLGLSLSAVRMTMCRARKALRLRYKQLDK